MGKSEILWYNLQIHDEAKKFSYQTGVKVVVAYGGAPISQQVSYLIFYEFHLLFFLNQLHLDHPTYCSLFMTSCQVHDKLMIFSCTSRICSVIFFNGIWLLYAFSFCLKVLELMKAIKVLQLTFYCPVPLQTTQKAELGFGADAYDFLSNFVIPK